MRAERQPVKLQHVKTEESLSKLSAACESGAARHGLEWLPTCVQVCLKHQGFAILGRFSEVGVNRRALVHWKFYVRQAAEETKMMRGKALSGNLPTHYTNCKPV